MKKAMGRGAVVLLALALATALTEASFALGAELTFEWYVGGVACVAWWCGRRSALVMAILSSVAVNFAFLPFHGFSFGLGLADAARLLVFVGLALLVAHLVSARGLAQQERERRERLLATVAHELGNMIFALRTWTAALQRDRGPGEQRDRAIRGLAQTADAITKLTGDLLDWSRIALGRLDLQPGDVDLAEVVQDAIQEMKCQASELGVKLSWSLVPTHVHADRARLHQVALNLLTNSLKATRQGGEVTISVCRADHRAVFSVRDTGHGIPPQVLQRVFDSGSLRSESKGLGLGLALSRDLIRAQGGDVTVQSGGLGTGATVSVELPAAWATRAA
jgi:signal transduction histidine kinase